MIEQEEAYFSFSFRESEFVIERDLSLKGLNFITFPPLLLASLKRDIIVGEMVN